MADERFQALPIEGNEKFRRVLRLVYLFVIFLLTLITSLHHDQTAIKAIVDHVLIALNVVDPFLHCEPSLLICFWFDPASSPIWAGTTYMD
jgi:hypothetical protein